MIDTPMQGEEWDRVSLQENETGIGIHILADFWGCDCPGDAGFWSDLLRRATEAMGATLLHLHAEPFTNNGMTAVAVLAESHIAVHTWPERDYIAIDLFTCGDRVAPERGIEVIRAALAPAREAIVHQARGRETADVAVRSVP